MRAFPNSLIPFALLLCAPAVHAQRFGNPDVLAPDFPSPQAVIEKFRDELLQRGLFATIRKTRGDDIDAACGQLKGQVNDRTRRQAEFRSKIEQGSRHAA